MLKNDRFFITPTVKFVCYIIYNLPVQPNVIYNLLDHPNDPRLSMQHVKLHLYM